jgi:uncharacterized protein YhfF
VALGTPSRPPIERLIARLRERGVTAPLDAPGIEWFGDNAKLCAELGDLVRQGVKRASAGLAASWEAEADPLPRAGDVKIVIDWDGEPLAVIEITEVRIQPFDQVDEAFARDEGEGDGTLAWWRQAHRRYFARECARHGLAMTDTMPVVCWRFRLIHAVPRP